MSREGFKVIDQTMLWASDNEKKEKDKIESFMKKLVSRFQSAIYPYVNVFIDEMVIKFKGCWKQKQYNPNKPAKYPKYHIKMYDVCDSVTSYAYNSLTYFGTDTSCNLDRADIGMSEKIFWI